MERRKFIAGVGSLAAGAAVATGTGAFTTVEASRDAEIDLEDDANAYLGLVAGQENGWAVQTQGGSSPGGTIMIEMNGQSNTSGGTGVNADALSTFDDVFRVQNQADDEKDVWIEFSPASSSTVNQSNINWQDRIDFYTPSGSLVGSGNAQSVSAGDELKVGIEVDLLGLSPSDYATDGSGNLDTGHILSDITIHAEDV